ncbi:MAG: bifunctional pyr operon transcriptional regulator/uracil phosphoribosyltransferase PyrR [Chitinophagaceae bacterium]|nr:bifunctional pyr operon transcriptional regulator/uracil phosphoribosyltransferase PyrR [Bacteroidota bacterium]MCC6258545.1 bifunctional pyr operon transcriptional regulator/uracil phosphoribosyltransferase PyrR [Chitinophagaceae bacterium]MCW5916292.1 bifunctional pyr operon transcriptional regulator/uracil phosphoribosyltransferase PyrR [Ferruginibacter sp.]
MQVLFTPPQLSLTIRRMAAQLVENSSDISKLFFVGIQPRGVFFAEKLMAEIQKLYPGQPVNYGILDITFYRDDVRNALHAPSKTNISFSIEGQKVILIDDVLYTGRTIRAALDALQDFGRPARVELCVLVDRRFNRELPIQPDFWGRSLDTISSQKVKVDWDKEEVVIYT